LDHGATEGEELVLEPVTLAGPVGALDDGDDAELLERLGEVPARTPPCGAGAGDQVDRGGTEVLTEDRPGQPGLGVRLGRGVRHRTAQRDLVAQHAGSGEQAVPEGGTVGATVDRGGELVGQPGDGRSGGTQHQLTPALASSSSRKRSTTRL